MQYDQDTKTFFGVITLFIGLAVGINEIVVPGVLPEWGVLAGALSFGISAVFWAWLWQDARAESAANDSALQVAGDSALQLPQVIEWQIAAPMAEEPVADAPAENTADDLKMIEGVGPVYSKALNDAGITTFAQVAAVTEEQLREALTQAGISRIPASIETWTEQAKLAAARDWDALDKLKAELDGGRRVDE